MLRAWKAVFWSFLGIRKGRDLQSDAQRLKPAEIIAAGLLGAAIFVASLIVLVSWITR